MGAKSQARSTVLLVLNSQYAHVFGRLARILKTKYCCDSVLVISSLKRLPAKLERIDLDLSDFREVIELEPIITPRPESELPSSSELAAEALAIETEYEVSILDMIRADRHIGIGFVTGAKFPASRYGRSMNFAQSVDVAVRVCRFYETLLRKYRPIGVFGSAGSIQYAPLIDLANSIGVPTRFVVKGRKAKEEFHWTINRYGEWWGVRQAYEHRLREEPLPTGTPEDILSQFPRIDTPYRTVSQIRSKNTGRAIFDLLVKAGMILLRDLKTRVAGRRTLYGNYFQHQELTMVFNRWLWWQRVQRERPILDRLPRDLPFVFFPLQVEPESNMFVENPANDNQLTVIDWLCKTLPPGWYLVVKEHPNRTTPRPAGFYERIRRYPNAILAATLEDTYALLDRAKALAMINATLGYQAAVQGKPVLSFNPHFLGLVMPHVFAVESYADCGRLLRRIAKDELPDMATRLQAARAFIAAIDDCSFVLEDPAILLGVASARPASHADVERIAAGFMQTLEADGPYDLSESDRPVFRFQAAAR